MADLTTVANVKQWLGVTNAADDALITRLITAVSTWIQEWLGRTIVSGAYTETLNGNGKTILPVLRYPVTAVASVTIDGVVIPARPAPGQSGYYFDSDFLYLDGYSFTKNSRQNVVITYTAGFASVPADLEHAANVLSAFRYRDRDHIGLSSKGLAGEQTNFIVKDMPEDIRNILMSYRRVTPV